jgi:hypothetical protein
MKQPSQSAPPFSPALLAGVFERLSGLGDPVFLIDPVDMPLVFVLDRCPGAEPSLCGQRRRRGGDGDYPWPLLTLVDLRRKAQTAMRSSLPAN